VSGPGLRARFDLDPATRALTYTLSVHGLSDDEVLFTHLHRATDGAPGPVVHLLGGRGQPRASGTLTLTAPELGSLRAGDLYVDVHTTEHLQGIRAVVAWPGAE
jgi:hypothetical protein